MQLFFPHLPPTLFKGKCAFFPRFPEANIHFPFYVIQKLHSAEKSQKRSQKEVRGGAGEIYGQQRHAMCRNCFACCCNFAILNPQKNSHEAAKKGRGVASQPFLPIWEKSVLLPFCRIQLLGACIGI